MEEPHVILVDSDDNKIGTKAKILAHETGDLHRAFSIFIFSKTDQTILLQKRAASKYHSSGKWSNSCCSHPYDTETWRESLTRCISDELGYKVDFLSKFDCNIHTTPQFLAHNLFFCGYFTYFSDYEDLKEHEIDYVFLLLVDKQIKLINLNPNEVEAVRWVSKDEIDVELQHEQSKFSSWFPAAFNLVKRFLSEERMV